MEGDLVRRSAQEKRHAQNMERCDTGNGFRGNGAIEHVILQEQKM